MAKREEINLSDLTDDEKKDFLKDRNYFPFYRSYRETFAALEGDEAKELLLGLAEYQFTGKEPDFRGNRLLEVTFVALKTSMDGMMAKYINTVDRNRENGKKGGRPKKETETQHNPENPDGFIETQHNPENPDGFIETQHNPENPNMNRIDMNRIDMNRIDLKSAHSVDAQPAGQGPPAKNKKNKVKEVDTSIITDYFGDGKVDQAFNEFLKARKEAGTKNTERAIKLLVDKLKPYPHDVQYKAITESIMNGWKGVFPENSKNTKAEQQGTGNQFLDMMLEEQRGGGFIDT